MNLLKNLQPACLLVKPLGHDVRIVFPIFPCLMQNTILDSDLDPEGNSTLIERDDEPLI